MDYLARFKDGTPSLTHWVIELHVEIIHYLSEEWSGIYKSEDGRNKRNILKLTC